MRRKTLLKRTCRIMAGMLALAALLEWPGMTGLPFLAAAGKVVRAAEDDGIQDTELSDPRIEGDCTWDCVYFGSYPQGEVISMEIYGNYRMIEEDCLNDGDLILDDDTYHILERLPDEKWDEFGDVTLEDGTRYRRLNKEGAYLGNNDVQDYEYKWEDRTTYHYFKYEPIKWRVLSVEDGQALILADRTLDNQLHGKGDEAFTWKEDSIRSWLNGYGISEGGWVEGHNNKNFYDTAFTDEEKEMIAESKLLNRRNVYDPQAAELDTCDKIFFLSKYDLYTEEAIKYGFPGDIGSSDKGLYAKSSTYAKARGGWWNNYEPNRISCSSWPLRAIGKGEISVVEGVGIYMGVPVRMALRLYLGDSGSRQWSYAGTCTKSTAYKVVPYEPVNPRTQPSDPRIFPDSPTDGTVKGVWDYIWFGRYPQKEAEIYGKEKVNLSNYGDEDWDRYGDLVSYTGRKFRRARQTGADEESYPGYDYYQYEPIKWLVLSVKDGRALLAADTVLESLPQDTSGTSWEDSLMRSWLNGYSAAANRQGRDCEQDNFIDCAFTEDEQKLLDGEIFLLSEEGMRDVPYSMFASRNGRSGNGFGDWKKGEVRPAVYLDLTVKDEKARRWSYAGTRTDIKYCSGISLAPLSFDYGELPIWLQGGGQEEAQTEGTAEKEGEAQTGGTAEKESGSQTEGAAEEGREAQTGGTAEEEIGSQTEGNEAEKEEKPETTWYVYDGVQYRVSETSSEAVCTGVERPSIKSAVIPGSIRIRGNDYRVTRIGKKAFAGCGKLRRVSVGPGVTVIEKNAFQNCNVLKKIVLRSRSPKKIGKNAFRGISRRAVFEVAKPEKYRSCIGRQSGRQKTMKIERLCGRGD